MNVLVTLREVSSARLESVEDTVTPERKNFKKEVFKFKVKECWNEGELLR